MSLTPLDTGTQARHKLRNWLQTWLLIGGSVALLAYCAFVLWGWIGLIAAAISGAVGLAVANSASPAMMLKLYRARPLNRQAFPEGYRILEILTRRAGLPAMPVLHYVPSRMMNAFAVGTPESSAIAITDGLLRGLDLRQLAGVLAHEVSHVRNEDVKVMALADVVARLTSAMSAIGIFALAFRLTGIVPAEHLPWTAVLILIAAPTIGGLLQLALSRAREYDADLDAVGLTGDLRPRQAREGAGAHVGEPGIARLALARALDPAQPSRHEGPGRASPVAEEGTQAPFRHSGRTAPPARDLPARRAPPAPPPLRPLALRTAREPRSFRHPKTAL